MKTIEQINLEINKLREEKRKIVADSWENDKKKILSMEWAKGVNEFYCEIYNARPRIYFNDKWMFETLESNGHCMYLADNILVVADRLIVCDYRCFIECPDFPLFLSFLKFYNISVTFRKYENGLLDFLNNLRPKMLENKNEQ